jgi:hypothetical protein
MSKLRKFFERLMGGECDSEINFAELCGLLHNLGFDERIKGDHHIFFRDGVFEIINLQPDGSQAKPYQVKQVRKMIRLYHLKIQDGR